MIDIDFFRESDPLFKETDSRILIKMKLIRNTVKKKEISIFLPIFGPQLLQLGHDAVCDVGNTLGVETIHHALDDVHLVLDREIDEIGVH